MIPLKNQNQPPRRKEREGINKKTRLNWRILKHNIKNLGVLRVLAFQIDLFSGKPSVFIGGCIFFAWPTKCEQLSRMSQILYALNLVGPLVGIFINTESRHLAGLPEGNNLHNGYLIFKNQPQASVPLTPIPNCRCNLGY